MEILLLALTAGLPLVKILLFPARTMGRGGNWTLVGAAMIVALMMALWFGMQSVSDTVGDANAATSKSADASPLKQSDIDALAKLLN
jgi:hypothetical protein